MKRLIIGLMFLLSALCAFAQMDSSAVSTSMPQPAMSKQEVVDRLAATERLPEEYPDGSVSACPSSDYYFLIAKMFTDAELESLGRTLPDSSRRCR